MRGRGEGVKNEGMGDRGRFTEDRASSWGRGGYERWERTDQREWRQKEKNWEEFEGKDLVEGGAEQET